MPQTIEATPIAPSWVPSPDRRLSALDLLGMALLSAVLLALSFIQSRHRIFWGDEIMGDLVLNAGSWHAFLERWKAGIDSSGFWFYVFAKPWEWIFGRSEVSLRMFSGAGIAIAAAFIWASARRFYTTLVVAVSVSFVFLDVTALRWQLANGRCYGVFMSSFALVLYLVIRGEENQHRRPSPLFLVCTFLAYDMLAGSHILGMLYAGALLAMQLGLDLRARRFRPTLYLAAALGIVLIVALSLPNIHSTTALGKPVFWTLRPDLRDLTFRSELYRGPVLTLVALLVALSLVTFRLRPSRRVVYSLLIGFVLLDLAMFGISRLMTSIYVDRYLLPFALPLVLLCAECLTSLREAQAPHPRLRAYAPVILALLALRTMPRSQPYFLPQEDYTAPLLAKLPAGLPVIDTDAGSFVELEHYHHGRFNRPFFFPIDPGVTADPKNPGGVSGFHEMDNFQRLGLYMPDLQPTAAILGQYPELLIITGHEPTVWLRRRIIDTGRYLVTDLGPLPGLLPNHLYRARLRQPALPLASPPA